MARWVEPDELGLFAVVFATAAVLIGLVRGTVGTFVLVFPGEKEEHAHRALATLTLLGAAGATGAALVCGVLLNGTASRLALALSAILPGVLLQEFGRNLAFSVHRPAIALRSDILWLAGLVALLAPARLLTGPVEGATLAWGGGALLALIPLRELFPRPGRLGALRGDRATNLWYLGVEAASLTLANNVLTHIVALAAGLPAAGSLRLARTLYGPVSSLMSGLESVLTPRAAQDAGTVRTLNGLWWLVVTGVAGLSATTVIGLHLMTPLGTAIFGTNWALAAPLFLPLALALAASGVSAASILVLRVTGQIATSAVGKSLLGTLAVAAGGLGAGIAGAIGAAWAAVTVNAVAAAWFTHRARDNVFHTADQNGAGVP